MTGSSRAMDGRDADDIARRRYIESTGRKRFMRFWSEFVRRRPLGTAGLVLIVVITAALNWLR